MAGAKISGTTAASAALRGDLIPVDEAGVSKSVSVTQIQTLISAATLGLPLALTGATTATRYVGGTAAGPPTTGTFAVGDFVVTAEGLVWACTSAGTPGTWTCATAYDAADRAMAAGGGYETASRRSLALQAPATVPASGTLYLVALYIPAGFSVGHISFVSSGTAALTPTHWWSGLYDSSRVQLAVTADQTNAAYGAYQPKPLAIATIASGASSTFVTTYSGRHYVGWMMTAGTVATNWGGVLGGSPGGIAPFLAGISDTGQTTPPAFAHTAATISTDGGWWPWAYVAA